MKLGSMTDTRDINFSLSKIIDTNRKPHKNQWRNLKKIKRTYTYSETLRCDFILY